MTERGSTKVLLERMGKRKFSDEELKDAVTILEKTGVDIVDIFPLGIPAPDLVSGKLRVNPSKFPALAEALLNMKSARIREFKVFPEGIVRPDVLQVEFQLAPAIGD